MAINSLGVNTSVFRLYCNFETKLTQANFTSCKSMGCVYSTDFMIESLEFLSSWIQKGKSYCNSKKAKDRFLLFCNILKFGLNLQNAQNYKIKSGIQTWEEGDSSANLFGWSPNK